MSVTAVDGVVAAGHFPSWVIPASVITTDPTEGTWEIPLSALTDPTAIKFDCHMDVGDLTVERTASTRSAQRACEMIARTIKTGETINVTLNAVFNQNAGTGDATGVNDVYDALPEDADVYVAQAFGWDSGTAPDATTVIDLYKGSVQTRMKNQPANVDEDLKFQAVMSMSGYFEDIALTGV